MSLLVRGQRGFDKLSIMIYLFHGDNQFESRKAFNDQLDQIKDTDILRLDPKSINLDQINLFLQESSLFNTKKALSISNLFSANKALLDPTIKLLNQSPNIDIFIWQDKTATATQIKGLKNTKIKIFSLDNKLFTCLNSIKPKNLIKAIPLYEQVLNLGLYDLFIYLLKNNFRRQFTTYPKFSPPVIKRTYLQLIELDFQNKTGQLSIPKELALKRIIINLTK